MPGQDYEVLVPMSELLALYEAVSRRNGDSKQVEQLRRELEGIRRMLYETMSLVNELRKDMAAKRP